MRAWIATLIVAGAAQISCPAAEPVAVPDPAYTVVDLGARFNPATAPPEQAEQIKALKAAIDKVKTAPPAKDMKVAEIVKVTMKTSRGDVTLELNAKEAPLHVKSFVHLAQSGFYDKTVFHRFADLMGEGKGRIIQGGDPLSKDDKSVAFSGMGGPGYNVPRERNKLKHEALVIAAARSQNPNSAGSQFYLTLDPTYFLDQGDGYTVFGKVIAGGDVVMKLQKGDVLTSVTVEK